MFRTCSQCGDEANKPNMHPNHNGDLICSECFRGPVADDASDMPALSEIEIK